MPKNAQLLAIGPLPPITGKPAYVIYGRGPEARAIVTRVLATQQGWLGTMQPGRQSS